MSETPLSASLGPTREAWLGGPSFSHWGLLPREPSTQSHLHDTVIVSTRIHMKPYVFHLLSILTCNCCVYRQTQHIRNIAEELDPTFQARRQGTESLRVGQTGTVNRKNGTQNETVKTIAEHSHPFSLQYRANQSVTSHAAFWLTWLPWRAHFHPTHKTANGQIRAL